nr:hypothetical protein GCM10020093_081680 [Planobispora longispora]
MAILDRLNAERGVGIVLVTHDSEVAAHARRQIHVRDGLIEYDSGTADGATGRDEGRTGPVEAG